MSKNALLSLIFSLLLPTTLFAQTPLNRLDELFLSRRNDEAQTAAQALLADSAQSDSQKKATEAYLQMVRILSDSALSGKEKRAGLDEALKIADAAVASSPTAPDAYYARALNRMFAANMVREFSSLNAITAAKEDFVLAINADPDHFGALSELSGVYGYMPEWITFGDRNIAVNLAKTLYQRRGSRRDAQQLAALLLRRRWSDKKRSAAESENQKVAAETAFAAAVAFEGSPLSKQLHEGKTFADDKSEADYLIQKFSLSADEVSGESAWNRPF